VEIVHKLAELGAYGVNLHDNDLIPRDASTAERDKIVKDFKAALQATGPRSRWRRRTCSAIPSSATARSPASTPRCGGMRSRRRCVDGPRQGAGRATYVFWGGREGTETNASKDPQEAMKWFRDALELLCEYSIAQGYDYKFALEPKPNEPRGDIFLPTIGHALALIYTLDHPEMVG
jgi:xylose isomerase